MADINTFQEKLLSLIRKFEKDKHHYLSKDYIEAQVRQDFINPFFEALGCNPAQWDEDIENPAVWDEKKTKAYYKDILCL